LISIGDKISSVYLFTGYARRMAQWDQKRKDDFVALIDSLDDHVGIAGFHLPLLNVLGHFHTEVRQRSRAILRAIQDGDEKAFDKEMEGWTKKVGEQWEEVQAAIRNIVLSGEATTA
jgi:ABC-type molybdate transport system ATPase subunit